MPSFAAPCVGAGRATVVDILSSKWNGAFHLRKWIILFHFWRVNGRLQLIRKDAVENRQAIVEVASTLIAQMGPDVSLRTIAKEAGVGVATASRHFPDREGLYLAVIEHTADTMRDVVDRHLTRFPDAPDDTWRSTIGEMVSLNFPAVGQEILPKLLPTLTEEDRDAAIAQLQAIYEPLLTQAKRYELCPQDLDYLSFHFAIIALSRPLPEPAEEVFAGRRAWLVDVFIDGLRAQRAR